MKNHDETILEILQGHKTSKWPTAKLIKIFIASSKTDFLNERKILLENIGPELNTIFEDEKIEVELVDMHFGAEDKDLYVPQIFEDHLHEIRMCHKVSRGCFFLSLVGNKYEQFIVPPRICSEHFEALIDKAGELKLNCDILEKWYCKTGNEYTVKNCRLLSIEELKELTNEIIDILHQCMINMNDAEKRKIHTYIKSIVEQKFDFALGLAPGTAHRVLSIIRDWNDPSEETENIHQENCTYQNKNLVKYCDEQIKLFHANIKLLIPEENSLYFKVPSEPNGIKSKHDAYLNEFKTTVLNKLKGLIRKCIDDEPELKSKKKIVQENFEENITHLSICYEDIKLDYTNSDIVERIRQIVQNRTDTRHNPILIYGNHGSGKTSLLQTIYRNFDNWFTTRTLKIVRFTGTTPRSSYNLELLRVICQQICIALKLPEGFLPKDASFDPLYINNWFQTLLRNFEDMNQILVIFIDDLHRLNPLDTEVIGALSWIPITLPKKVHFICTTSIELENLRMTQVQKERFKNSDSYIELPPSEGFSGNFHDKNHPVGK